MMHDLITTTEQLPGGALTEADVESVVGYAQAATAESTRAAYTSDMASFRHWCTARGICPLPASPAHVAAYLAHLADSGRKASGIGRAAAGIAWHHRQAGIDPPPTAHEGVKQTLRGIRRTIGAATKGKEPIVAAMLEQMLKHCPDTLAGERDRALLSLCFAGAFRRSEVCALEVPDLTATPDGYRIRIRRSKTDAAGLGQEIAVIRGVRIQPVAAVEAWLEASGITEGPVFRAVALGSRMSATAMTSNALAGLIKRYCRKIGIDPANYSGHSMRSGYVTSAVEVNAPLLKIAEQTRHASLDMLRVYSRRVDLFKEHSGAGFL
jgi:integrase